MAHYFLVRLIRCIKSTTVDRFLFEDSVSKTSLSWPKRKGAYGFSYVMRAFDVDDVIYDVTLGNIKHAVNTLCTANYCKIYFLRYYHKTIKTFTVFEYLNVPNKTIENYHKPHVRLCQLVYMPKSWIPERIITLNHLSKFSEGRVL